ncbi:MAG: hypothetical protein HZB39_13760 [Planctomycetes bacterium]|nr:hypothetical protein [Planctomycetota bacterium]
MPKTVATLAVLCAAALPAQELLLDLEPMLHASVRELTAVGSRVFFIANSAADGEDLWVTDGSPSGTRQVAELSPRALVGGLFGLKAVGARIVFGRFENEGFAELWSSDGTVAGTVRLHGYVGRREDRIDLAVAANGLIWFAGADGRPWISDGTVAGTRRAVASDRYAPHSFTAFAGEVWFFVETGTRQYELLRGTGQGDVDVIDSVAYSAAMLGATSTHLYVWSSSNYPAVDRRAYGVDGTRTSLPGTERLGKLQFEASDAAVFVGGTYQRPDLLAYRPGAAFVLLAPDVLILGTEARTPAGAAVAFALGQSRAWSLLTTDGTTVGTTRSPIAFPSGSPSGAILLAGNLARSVWIDPDHRSSLLAFPLDGSRPAVGDPRFSSVWAIHDAPFGTLIAGKLAAGNAGLHLDANGTLLTLAAISPPTLDSNPRLITRIGDRVFFLATDARGVSRWWSTSGDPADVVPLIESYTSIPPQALGDRAILNGGQATWISDGTRAGTERLRYTLEGGENGLNIAARTFAVLFDALWGGGGNGIVTTDGTIEGTRALPHPTYGSPLATIGDQVLFLGRDPATGLELWVTGGREDTTHLVADIWPGPEDGTRVSYYGRPDAANLDGLAYFTGNDGIHGMEPWCTDGTPQGTRMLVDLQPGPQSSYPGGYIRVGSRVAFFTGSGGGLFEGDTIWITDGATTRPLAQRTAEFWSLTALGDRLFLADHGRPLECIWTALSPPRIETILATSLGSYVLPIGDRALIEEVTPNLRRLLVTDGTAAGTTWLADMGLPWYFGGSVAILAPRNRPSVAVFGARRRDVGNELFTLALASLPGNTALVGLGSGCSRPGKEPATLWATAPPRLGDPNGRLELHGAPSSSAGVLLVSDRLDAIALQPDCVLHGRDPVWIPIVTAVDGSARVAAPVPSSPSFLGLELVAQCVVAVPSGALLGIADVSTALRLIVGR